MAFQEDDARGPRRYDGKSMRTFNHIHPLAAPAGASRAWGPGLLLVLVLAAGWVGASDRVLIPSASELWRTRLKQSLAYIREGRVTAGLEMLQVAVMNRGGVLYEVRDEELLGSPLDVEIEDDILVTEKSEAPRWRFPPRSGFGIVSGRAHLRVDDTVGRVLKLLPV